MNKEEHIAYWIDGSKRDLIRLERCYTDKDFVFALFCLHLALEKTIKALWIKFNADNFPSRIHNLVKLIGETHVLLSDEQLIFLNDMNRFQLEGRYPDYTGQIYMECTKEVTLNMLEKGKNIQKWLIQNTL